MREKASTHVAGCLFVQSHLPTPRARSPRLPGGECQSSEYNETWVAAMDPFGGTGALPVEIEQAVARRFSGAFAAYQSRSAAISRVTFWCAGPVAPELM